MKRGLEMNRKMLGACAVGLLAILPVAASGQDVSPPPLSDTQGRLSHDQMDELVSEPMTIVQTRGLAAGKAAFERLLARARARHGARSVEVADLLQSFGVGLFGLGRNSEDRLQQESIPYLEAAISAYRAAFGSGHPEVAIALNTLADAQLEMDADDPPQSVEAAYEETYRIRLAAFGPTNINTLASLRYLASVRGLPSRMHGDPVRIDAVASLFRRLIANSSNNPGLRYDSSPYAYSAFARMYARNGMSTEAREQLRLASELTRTWPEWHRCLFSNVEIPEVEALIEAHAPKQERPGHAAGGVTACISPDMTPAAA